MTLSDDIHWFQNVRTIDDYLAARGEMIVAGRPSPMLPTYMPKSELLELTPNPAHPLQWAEKKGPVTRADIQAETIEQGNSRASASSQHTEAPTKGIVTGVDVIEGDPRAVFLVHGWNRAAREAMTLFLRALDLRAMTWEDAVDLAGDPAADNLTVVREGMAAARAVVVVITGDDEARARKQYRKGDSKGNRLVPQPRPNVLLEIGMALCISQRRTILARFEEVRETSDIVGLNYVTVNNGRDSREALRRRLRTVGCQVREGLDYLDVPQAGDFEAAVADRYLALDHSDQAILDQLSDRDQCLLKLLEMFEATYPLREEEHEIERTFRFWSAFRAKACLLCGITDAELDSVLRKLSHTELYESYRPNLIGDMTQGRTYAGKLTPTYYRLARFVAPLDTG